MSAIRTLIVDDEPLARTRMRRLLEDEADIEIVGEAENGLQAVAAVAELGPDLLFLDINMPEMSGLEFVASLPTETPPPAIIFVTAFDQHAVKAFDVNALDYLLKPFDEERFQLALTRARQRMQTRPNAAPDAAAQIQGLLSSLQADAPSAVRRLVVKHMDGYLLVNVSEIDCVQAAGKLVKVRVGGDEYSLRETLQNLENRLDPAQFARIHRSTIVNLDAIDALEPTFNGEFQVRLKNGMELTLSRSYRARLNERFGNTL